MMIIENFLKKSNIYNIKNGNYDIDMLKMYINSITFSTDGEIDD